MALKQKLLLMQVLKKCANVNDLTFDGLLVS